MIMMMSLSAWHHKQLEFKALYIKIEKLEAWMKMYRDGKLPPEQTRPAIEIMLLIHEAKQQQIKLLNNN